MEEHLITILHTVSPQPRRVSPIVTAFEGKKAVQTFLIAAELSLTASAQSGRLKLLTQQRYQS